MDSNLFEETAGLLGLRVTKDVVNRGEFGVNFLSRFYSDQIWRGELDSMCDLGRQIPKFFLTVHMNNVTPTEKLIEKARAFILTDANTPIIGPLCRKVQQLCVDSNMSFEMTDQTSNMRKWNSDLDIEVQYPNNTARVWGGYYYEAFKEQHGFDSKLFYKHLKSCKSLEDVLQFPLCGKISVESKHPVLAGDFETT
jgi:hypothetical protein